MKKVLMEKILLVVFCVFLPVLLLLFSYKLVYSLTDYTDEQQGIVDYLEGAEVKVLADKEEAMTEEGEWQHLEEVKSVMKGVDYGFYLLLLICTLTGGYLYRSKDKQLLKRGMFWGGMATAVLLAMFLVGVGAGFEWLFTLFHKVFFPEGNWVFSFDSFLIKLFPSSFFFWMAVKIGASGLFLGIIFIVGSVYLGKFGKKDGDS